MTLRTICTAALALTLAGGAAESQVWKKGEASRDRYERDRYERARRAHVDNGRKVPPGLAKKGGLPPGQAKKYYRTDRGALVLRDAFGRRGYTVVRTARDGDVRYVYYRPRGGSLRRAAVRPGRERLVFVNVPDAVLREVVARLY